MHTTARLLLPLALVTGLAAQGGGEAPAPAPGTEDVTQQERNALRAAAYKAAGEGRFGDAADAFLALTRAAPERVDWVVEAGRCLGRAGRFGEAVDLLDAARKRFVGAVDVNAMLARTLLLQTERDPGVVHPEVMWAEAADITEAVLARDPSHADCRLLLAQARYLLGQPDEAQRHADEAVARHPDRPGSHVLVGRLASDRMRRLLAELPGAAEDEAARADLVKRLHEQREKAKAAFSRAASLDPSRAYPHVALSQLATLDGKGDQARAHLHDALAIDPETPVDHARLTKGLGWEARRDLYRRLRARFEAAAATPQADRARKAAALRFHEARAALDGLQFEAARTAFQAVAAADPGADSADYYLFLCDYHLGDYDDAEAHAAKYARRSAPGFADVLRALPTQQRVQIAAMVQFLGDRAYGEERIDNSRDLNHVTACLKDSADAWNNHAFLCRETGDFEQAYTSYQYAIQREPGSPQLWNDAAVVLQYHLASDANLDKARGMYEKALQLAAEVLRDPNASEAQREFAAGAQRNARLNLEALDKQR